MSPQDFGSLVGYTIQDGALRNRATKQHRHLDQQALFRIDGWASCWRPRAVIANIKQWAIVGFALFCLVAGTATIWLPIPTGVPLLALGAFLVIANSRIGRKQGATPAQADRLA